MIDHLAESLASTEYEGIPFPVTEVKTSWGHTSVRHRRYLSRGADIEHTGQKEREIRYSIPLIDGMLGPWGHEELFVRTYPELIAKFAEVPQGTLAHPTLGPITVQIDSIDETFSPEIINGVLLEVVFTRHLGDEDQVIVDARRSNDPVNRVERSAAAVDAASATIPAANRPPSVLADMEAALEYCESAERTYSQVNDRINDALGKIDDVLRIASDIGTAAHNVKTNGLLLRSGLVDYVTARFGVKVPGIYTVPATMSLSRIAVAVYGDPSKASLLRSANKIPDEMFVRAGTILIAPAE